MMTSGVYAIINQVNERAYIGGSTRLNQRWKEHRSDLRNGYHHSHSMQADYNQYSLDVFEFIVIDYCPDHLVFDAEQIALDYLFEHHQPDEFYNTARCAEASRLGLELSEDIKKKLRAAAVKSYDGFISPEGQPVYINNLSQFCRDNGLHISQMHNLWMGRQKSCHGWTVRR